MSDTITIRLAQDSDSPELLKLNDLFNGEGCNSLSAIEESLNCNEQKIVCVAAESSNLIGFCCGQIFKSMCYSVNYGEITELFVLQTYRRQGVTRGLIAFIEVEFQKQGINHFQLFTGKSNEVAQTFYRAQGYMESSEMMFRKRPEGD